MRGAIAAALLAASAASAGCHKPVAESEPHADLAGPVSAAPPSERVDASAASVRSARCILGPAVLGAGEGPRDGAEVGDAVGYEHGYAVGFIHRTPAGHTASVLLVDAAGTHVDVADLGPTLGDAPPSRTAPWAGGVLAAAYAVTRDSTRADAPRELAIFSLAPGAPLVPHPTVAQQRDDSLAFDVASTQTTALVVWDEATTAGRGSVRAFEVTPGAAVAPSHVISPADSDVEAPRLLTLGTGYAALWLAEQPDLAEHGDDRPPVEVPGEARSFGWVEAVALDAHGVPEGPVRRLTPSSGHVSAFDAEVLADGSLLVAARDDGEAVDGSGGALLRVRETTNRVEPPLAFANDGLGRGSPEFVAGRPSWLGWVGPEERVRFMPLDPAGAPSGPPSVEDALVDARPLTVVAAPASPGAAARVLVATPSDPGSPLHAATCAP